jgi:hypothetical protein
MIKLKSLLTEQAEFDSITKALQTAVNTFNASAATVLANEENKSAMTLIVSKQPIDTEQGGNLATTIYKWYIQLTTPNKSAGVILVDLQIRRFGAAKDVTGIGYSKILKLYELNPKIVGDNITYTGDFMELYFYNANGGVPKVVDATSSFNKINSNILTAIKNSNNSESSTLFRNTAAVILKSGPKLIQDLKSVFNSIEIAPFSAEAKKTWKGMKTV